jgi:hypothetical protein
MPTGRDLLLIMRGDIGADRLDPFRGLHEDRSFRGGLSKPVSIQVAEAARQLPRRLVDAPTPRRVQAIAEGHVIAFPEVGGLHHRYEWRVA